MSAITQVTAFVDWKSQVHVLKLNDYVQEDWFISKMFERLFRRVSASLSKTLGDGNYKISLRLYHGWHKGFEPQAIRRLVNEFVLGPDFGKVTQSQSAFIHDVAFGDRLLSARGVRLHRQLDIHLPNTLRSGRAANKPPYEKMVDTALAADFLTWATRCEVDGVLVCESTVAVVLGEDDDLWPPVLSGEPMWMRWGGRAFVIQDDVPSADMPNVSGLLGGS